MTSHTFGPHNLTPHPTTIRFTTPTPLKGITVSNATLYVADETNLGEPMLLCVEGRTYFRYYTGARGRCAAWQVATSENTPELLARVAVTVPVTKRDLDLLAAGQLTPINVKVMKAYGDANWVGLSEDEAATLWTIQQSHAQAKAFQTWAHTQDAQYDNEVAVEAAAQEETPVLVTTMTSVPDMKWHTEYIQRKVVGELSEYEIYDIALKRHENVLITGPAGSGKTMSVIAYAACRGYNYYNVSSHNGVEPTQLFGRWVPTTTGSFRWQDGPVTEIVRNGGVLLINEVNFMPERVKTVLFSLLDKRREIQLMDKDGEVIKAHPNLLIIADMNPGYRGTKPLNEAEKDRYAHKLDFGYDKGIEAKIIKSKALLDLAANLRAAFDKEEIITPISTRSLVAFMENAQDLGIDYAIYSFLNGFHESERSAVRLAVETRKANLGKDLGQQIDVLPQQADEKIIFTSASTMQTF